MADTTETPLGIVPFSRRTFFSMTAAVGALTFVGAVFSPTRCIQAWADEEGHMSFTVYVLSREEVPIMAYDITDSKNPQPIGGVKVTVTSHVVKGTEGTQTVTTDAKTGFAPMNVRKMSWQAAKDDSNVYNLWGRVEAELDGYRQYATEKSYIEAGTPQKTDEHGHAITVNEIRIPMQKIDDPKQPYLRQLTLNNFDIQYTQENKACAWKENLAEQTILAEIIAPSSKMQIEASLRADDNLVSTVDAQANPNRSNSYIATFTGPWLSTKDFKVGSTLSVSFGEKGAKTLRLCKSPLRFIEPTLLADGASGKYEDVSLSPGFEPQNETKDISEYAKRVIPPVFGGVLDTFQFAIPFAPVKVFINAHGDFGASITLLNYTFLWNEKGGTWTPKEQLEYFGGKGEHNGWNNLQAAWDNKIEDYRNQKKDMRKDNVKACRLPVTFSWGWNFLLECGVLGSAVKDTRTGYTSLNLDFFHGGQFGAWFGWMWPFMAGPVPMFVSLDFSVFINLCLYLQLVTDDYFRKYTWNKAFLKTKEVPTDSVVIKITFDFGLEGGVGIRGILSGSLRGYGYVVQYFSLDDARETAKKKQLPAPAWPHIHGMVGGDIKVIVVIFFIKKEINIFAKILPNKTFKAWDNRNKNALDEVFNYDFATEIEESEFGDFDVILDSDLAPLVKVTGRWVLPEGEGKGANAGVSSVNEMRAPVYDALPTEIDASTLEWPDVYDLINDEEDLRSPINGIVPKNQFILQKGSYMNPRLRIVHTDTSTFSHDRAFMVRLETAGITPPPAANGEEKWVIEDVDGNYYFAREGEAENPVSLTAAPRTRILVYEWDNVKRHWGPGYTIDFSVDGELSRDVRANSHDVDFDVDLHDGKLIIALSSMVRPEQPKDFEDYEMCQYLSVVNFDINAHKVVSAGTTYSVQGKDTGMFSPHILMQDYDNGHGKSRSCVVYSYLCKYDESRKRVSGGIAVTVFDSMGAGFASHRLIPPTLIVDGAYITSKGLFFEDFIKGTFEVSLPDRTLTVRDGDINRDKSIALIAWSKPRSKSTEKDLSYVFAHSYNVVEETKSGATVYTAHVKEQDCLTLSNVPRVTKFGDAKQAAVFGYSNMSSTESKKPLKVVKFDAQKLKLSLTDDMGDSEKTTYFTSFNGRRLYCVRSMDGKAPGAEPDIAQTAAEEGARFVACNGAYNPPTWEITEKETQVALYQLLEARYLDGAKSYTDFYPLAQIKWIPDNIGVIAVNSKYTHFTMATITDYDKDMCDICQVDVPLHMQAFPLSVAPSSPYTAAGYTCYYQCEIANTGNVPITSITMEVSVAGTSIKNVFDDLSKVMQASPDDVKTAYDEDGNVMTDDDGNTEVVIAPTPITQAGVFLPGTRRLFNLYFKVPSDKGLHGQTTFEVKLIDCANKLVEARFDSIMRASEGEDNVGGLPLFAEDDYLEPVDDPETPKSFYETPLELEFGVESEAYVQEPGLGPSDYATIDNREEPLPYDDDTDDDSSSGTAAPGTGDTNTVGILGAAAIAAAAAAAAGVAAYEKRRAENEDRTENEE